MKKTSLKQKVNESQAKQDASSVGASYYVKFKVGIPLDISNGGDATDSVEKITDYVTAALNAVTAEGVQCTLEHSTSIETPSITIPIIPRPTT